MRLVISLIPREKKIAFWNGRQSRSGGIDFGSPQFIFINCKLGFGAWKEDTLVCECIFFFFLHNSQGCEGACFSFLAMFTHFGSQKKKKKKFNIYKAREAKDHKQPS